MQNQLCRVCDEPAAGFHFGAFTCEGCKSFFGRTSNNQSVIQECKNNYRCVVDKKNRTACKACRLRKCLMVGMSKSGSRYGRRSNWFKIHCLMQQNLGGAVAPKPSPPGSSASSSSLSPTAPLALWPSPPKTDHKRDSPIVEVRESHSSSPPRSPEEPAASMVPRTSVVTPTSSPFSHLSAASPFKSLLPSLPISSASLPLSTASLSPITTVTPPAVPKTDPATAAAAAAAALAAPPIMSLYAGFPGLTAAGATPFPGVPLHKQALLSPLLAQSHLWQQMAALRQNPLMRPPAIPAVPAPPSATPDLDLINAEHKALMERFAAVAAAAAAAAVAAASEEEKRPASPASPPSSPKAASTESQPQNCPIDLSSKKSDDGNESEDAERSTPSSVVKADLNRNNIVDSEKKSEGSVLDLCNK